MEATRQCGGGGARSCAHCGTQKTPLWRNGPCGVKSLCNACGIRFKKLSRKGLTTPLGIYGPHSRILAAMGTALAGEGEGEGAAGMAPSTPHLKVPPRLQQLSSALQQMREEGVRTAGYNPAKHPRKRPRSSRHSDDTAHDTAHDTVDADADADMDGDGDGAARSSNSSSCVTGGGGREQKASAGDSPSSLRQRPAHPLWHAWSGIQQSATTTEAEAEAEAEGVSEDETEGAALLMALFNSRR